MQVQSNWVELPEFVEIAAKLVERYLGAFSGIEVDQIVAYACVNKDRPEGKKDPYKMTGALPPESLTNSKTYFIKMFNDVWERTIEQKQAIVLSALRRIDPQNPGKVKGNDHSDQECMINLFGANWSEKGDLPNLLKEDVDIEGR